MKLTLNLRAPDGSVKTVQGEALPKYAAPVLPAGVQLPLTTEDRARLERAVKRLHRCAVAQRALGPNELNFDGKGWIVAGPPINVLALKAMALEARPFFLNDDPLFFPSLVKLKSLGAQPAVAKQLRLHTKRWNSAAFAGVMAVRVGAHELNVANVVSAWFNSDFFHTSPMKPGELSVELLESKLGGTQQALALLAQHLTASLAIANDFVKDAAKLNEAFRLWLVDFVSKNP